MALGLPNTSLSLAFLVIVLLCHFSQTCMTRVLLKIRKALGFEMPAMQDIRKWQKQKFLNLLPELQNILHFKSCSIIPVPLFYHVAIYYIKNKNFLQLGKFRRDATHFSYLTLKIAMLPYKNSLLVHYVYLSLRKYKRKLLLH